MRTAQILWRPDLVMAWGERFDSPLWEGRTEGLAYLCRDFTCQRPVTEPDELYEQIVGRPVPAGMSIRRTTAPDDQRADDQS